MAISCHKLKFGIATKNGKWKPKCSNLATKCNCNVLPVLNSKFDSQNLKAFIHLHNIAVTCSRIEQDGKMRELRKRLKTNKLCGFHD